MKMTKKVLKSNQHSNKNNTLGTITVPKELKAGTYTLIKAKEPAEENNNENQSKTIEDIIIMMIGRTSAAVVMATIILYGYLIFRLMYDFITSLF